MQVGNYLVGYFRGLQNDGDYLRFTTANNPEGEGFVQSMNFRATRDDGSKTLEDDIEIGDLVLVRVFEEARIYGPDKNKAFVARRVLGVKKIADDAGAA